MDTECRDFFGEALQCDAHLLLVGFRLRFNSDRDRWIREFDRLKRDRVSGVGKRMTGKGTLEAGDCGNVTCTDGFDLFPLICMHTDDTTDTLLITGSSVKYVTTSGQLTAIDTDENESPNKWVGSNLKSECR